MIKTIKESTHTARKSHICGFCNSEISPGELYHAQFIISDYPYTWKSHTYCRELANKIVDFSDCEYGCTSDDFSYFVINDWENRTGKSSFGHSYSMIFDEVLANHNLKLKEHPMNNPSVIAALDKVEAPALEIAPGIWDIAPEREEVE